MTAFDNQQFSDLQFKIYKKITELKKIFHKLLLGYHNKISINTVDMIDIKIYDNMHMDFNLIHLYYILEDIYYHNDSHIIYNYIDDDVYNELSQKLYDLVLFYRECAIINEKKVIQYNDMIEMFIDNVNVNSYYVQHMSCDLNNDELLNKAVDKYNEYYNLLDDLLTTINILKTVIFCEIL